MTRAFICLLAALLLTAPAFAGDNPLSGRGATTGGPNTWAGTQTFSGQLSVAGEAANGEFLNIKSVTVQTSAMTSGATITLTNLIPADSLVMAVVARVTTEITGPTSWLLGVSGDTNQWGDTLALAADTTVDYTDYTNVKPPEFFTAATSVLITRGSASDFTAGVVRVTVIYFDATPPTQ